MNVPARGAWTRLGIGRDGGPLRDEGPAVWLQLGEFYADSRGFAGTTAYDGVAVCFHHEVGAPGEDVGRLAAAGDHLVETGTNPDGSTFFEVWRPLPDGGCAGGVWLSAGAQIVRVGRHVVHVDGTGGAYWSLP